MPLWEYAILTRQSAGLDTKWYVNRTYQHSETELPEEVTEPAYRAYNERFDALHNAKVYPVLPAILNYLGADGWELIDDMATGITGGEGLVFKRPVETAAPRPAPPRPPGRPAKRPARAPARRPPSAAASPAVPTAAIPRRRGPALDGDFLWARGSGPATVKLRYPFYNNPAIIGRMSEPNPQVAQRTGALAYSLRWLLLVAASSVVFAGAAGQPNNLAIILLVLTGLANFALNLLEFPKHSAAAGWWVSRWRWTLCWV